MNRVSLKFGVTAAVAALGVLFLALTTGVAASAQPIAKNGVIHSCVKAKGKNRGALRVVASARGCKHLRGGWRSLSWSAGSSTGASGQSGAQGSGGQQGPQGAPGPEGRQGVAGQIEKSLVDTVSTQASEIDALNKQVSSLTGELLNLEGSLEDVEGTVGETCSQLKTVTTQSDEILSSLLGSSVKVIGNLLNVPNAPEPLGTFECE